MTVNHTIKSPSAAAVPSLFCPPHLIAGEDPVAYDEFFVKVCATVKPADIIEEIWVRDFVDCDWDVRRYRRLKVALMAATAHEGLRKVLDPISFEGWLELVEDWAARKPEAIEEVNRRLAAAGLTIDAVMAQTLCEHLDEFKCIDAMIAMAEARRDGALCEIERHRATLAHRLRQTVQQSDAEYQTLQAKSAEPKRLSVTSTRKMEANRKNARASTGPKTAQGRARMARNAFRHGLSLPVCSDPVLCEEVESLVPERKPTLKSEKSRAGPPKRKSIWVECVTRAIGSCPMH